MSKFPEPEYAEPEYPSKYYEGYYIIRDPALWHTKGKIIPIRKLPRPRRPRPKQMWYFHPDFWMPKATIIKRGRSHWDFPSPF